MESNLRSAKKANIPKKQLKTKIPKTHLTPISKLFRKNPPGSTNQRWSKTTESFRLEVHLPLPLFSSRLGHDMDFGRCFFFFFRIIHSLIHFTGFQILISRSRLVVFSMVCSKKSKICSGLLVFSWSPKLWLRGFSPLYCFVMMFHPVFFSNILRFRQLRSKQSQRLEINPANLPKELCFCFCAKVGLHWSRNHKMESNTNMAATFLSSRP